MVGLFKDILRDDESLFLNPQFLDFDFQPKLIKFRETQQKQIAFCIKPLLDKRSGKNILVTGKPGIGKTVTLKNVLDELEQDYSDNIYTLYVNCWKKDSTFKVISEICEQVGYKYTFNRSTEDLLKSAKEIINKKSCVIVLDEIDKLQENSIVYTLLEEIFRKTLILITNEKDFLVYLDDRIKSRLLPEIIDFQPYKYNETKEILRERAKYAFVQDVLDEEALSLIAQKSFEMKDVRLGISLLKEAGEFAEVKSSRKILEEHTKEAIERFSFIKNKDLDEQDKKILSLLKDNDKKTLTEIFSVYESSGGTKSYRTFHRRVKDLEKYELFTVKEITKGAGRSSIVEINQSKIKDFT